MKTNIWSSLPVPSVQELLTTVPPRYVHPHQDPPFVSNATLWPQVPVIDLKKLLSGDLTNSELDKLHRACKEWGFFQKSHLV
ncbi:hypothetical protein Patl1_10278 [Pistacia atlantica]|uniref:Uncharacterized protein n=1 Tax=Pistacia atlantica TaxID=434234 RepID=A0ACC1A7B3_9ROSI|nr:hypothetical protein Patl1_10278 [Pistacia atlantica]